MRRRSLLFLTAPLLTFTSTAFAQDTLEGAVSNDLVLENVLNGLNGPTFAEFLPDGRIMFGEQNSGRVYVYDEAAGGSPMQVGELTIQRQGSERGLLGMAIDPMFATTNRIYFYYSLAGSQQVAWVTFTNDTLDVANPTVVIDGLASNRNHNGGAVKFGPDGMLYIGVGDTGCNCGCRPGTNDSNYFGTCLTNLSGKILRIDRDGNIPNDNPLIGETNVADCFGESCFSSMAPTATGMPRTEIYNWGFRNPWRFTWDSQTGNLWIGDVGEITWEEITVSTGPGQHHGWPYREGAEGQAAATCGTTTPQSGDCVDPAFAYPRASGGSVTAGAFANGCVWPTPWNGRYFFGDFVQNRTWVLQVNAGRDGVDGDRVPVIRHGNGGGPVHYFEAPNGAIYFVTAIDGEIWRLRPANPVDCGMDAGVVDTGVGSDDSGVGGPRDGGDGAARDAGSAVTPGPGPDDDDGCGCTATETKGAGGVLVGLLLLLLGTRRRR